MRHYRIVVADPASDDVLSIVSYWLTVSSVERASRVDHAIDAAIKSLASSPRRGRVVPELSARGIRRYRELYSAPYRIIYSVHEKDVHIVAVIDHRRSGDELLLERARR